MREFRNILRSEVEEKIEAGRPEISQPATHVRGPLANCLLVLGAAVLTLQLVSGLSGCGSNSSAFASASAALVITPAALDFGDVKVGTAEYRPLSITNQSKSTVQIARLDSSNNSFTVNAGTLPTNLPAGGSMVVEVRYDAGSATDMTAQLSLTTMTARSGGSQSTIKLHGKGSNSGTASLSGFSCAKSSMIGAGADTCTVALNSGAPSTGLVVNLSSSSGAITVPASVTVASGAKNASFSANVSAVSSSQTVTLTAAQGTVSKSTSISLSGSASSPITPSVSALSCGGSSFTGTGTTACTVSLSSVAPSSGLSVSVTSNNNAVTVPGSVTVPSGASTATFTANAASVSTSQTATLSASANSSSKSYSIQLNAAAPSVSLSTSSLAFGNVAVGTAVSKSVTVTSSGTTAVTINSDSVTGTGFSVSGGGFPATLNPGQAVVLTVQFDPTTASSATGQLTISSNAPTATVSLSGTGASVAPTVSAISCKSTSITGSLADSCTVNLSGSAPSGGVSVGLASSNGAVTVPASITVPATSTSAAFTANVASVTSTQSVTLTATTGSTSKATSLQLNAGVPTLTVNATSISFGAIVVNNSTTQTVTLTSTGTAAVTVNSVSVTGSGFSAPSVSMPATLNPGQSLSLTLTFSPTVVGSSSGQLAISSNSSANPSLPITLSGTATSPTYQVNLAWQAPTSSDPIAGYHVYRAPSGTSSWANVSPMNTQTAYTDTNVQSGQRYDYYVTSVDSVGSESSPSNTTTVSVP